jgi:hypothetical protein
MPRHAAKGEKMRVRALILAVPCILASLPALAEVYTVSVRFHNNSAQPAIANWHNDDEGQTVLTVELQPGAQISRSVSWTTILLGGETDTSEKYDLSLTQAGGRKCSATLHVTKTSSSAFACTVIDRINDGASCDAASELSVFGGKNCSATIRVDR